MASTLAKELVEEILCRIPPDDPADLVCAGLVCKAWRRILADRSFLRHYRRFHGTLPMLGYICRLSSDDMAVRFVPTTSVPASCVLALTLDCCRGPAALEVVDCRHGRVLIQVANKLDMLEKLIVWDPITGSQQHVSAPAYPTLLHNYTGAVLCAKDGCDHLDCHGGSFLVVLVATRRVYNDGVHTLHSWACVYSSETGAWSATTPHIRNRYLVECRRPSLLIGDVLYFIISACPVECHILKYELHKNELSVMDLPGQLFLPFLINGDDGGLAIAAVLRNCIFKWSWQVGIDGAGGEWVKSRVMEFDSTILAEGRYPPDFVSMVEGTNTVLIVFELTGTVFKLNLKSKQLRKIDNGQSFYFNAPILPYMSFYTPNY